MLKITNLTKSYRKNLILDDITFSIEKGKLTTFLGQNGAGKSTLLKILSGLEFQDHGSVHFLEDNVHKIGFSLGNEMIFINELIEIFIELPLSEYAELLSEKYKNYNHPEFIKIMSDCKLDFSKNYQDLSRGQRMQFLLAHALAAKPKILLLDEITSVIDVYARKYFLDALRKFCDEGGSVLITTNIINELDFYTDRLIILKNNKIVLDGTEDEVLNQFIKIRRTPNHKDHSIFNSPHCVWSNTNSDRTQSFILPKSKINQLNLPEEIIDRRRSNLEDIFVYYFNGLEKKKPNENAA